MSKFVIGTNVPAVAGEADNRSCDSRFGSEVGRSMAASAVLLLRGGGERASSAVIRRYLGAVLNTPRVEKMVRISTRCDKVGITARRMRASGVFDIFAKGLFT